MDYPYLEERDGTMYVRSSRVPLDALVLNWREGHSPEEIRDNFPILTLAEVYGAVAYYLDHQAELDRHLGESDTRYAQQRADAEAADPARYMMLRQRFAAARARRESSAYTVPRHYGERRSITQAPSSARR